MDSIHAMIETQRKADLGRANAHRPVLLAAMQAAGLTMLSLHYDGSGDDGCVNGVESHAPETVDLATLPPITFQQFQGRRSTGGGAWEDILVEKTGTLEDLATEVAYAALESLHPGWEINEGSYGRVEFHAKDGALKITLAHNERYEASEYSEHEL